MCASSSSSSSKGRVMMMMLLLLLCFSCSGQVSGEVARLLQVTGVLKGRAELPCDLVSEPDDQVTLVLWYKNDSGTPIYSLDVRSSGQTLETAKHMPADVLSNRAFFRVLNNEAFLQLEPVREQDEGVYRCRVDFRKSRTRNQQVNLSVIVPPEEAFIVDETGQEVTSPWNVNEGSKLILSCEAVGGKPTPRVTWWKGSKLLEETSEASSSGKVRSDLILPRLSRKDVLTNLTCQASNTNLTVPVSRTVTLDLNLHPLDVRILGSRDPLSAGKHYELVCRSGGSRPKPTVTWLKNSKRLKHAKDSSSVTDANVTISTISFIPAAEDNGKFLTCRVENPRMPGSVLEDSWKLDVYYVPSAHLELGSSLKKDNLKEGDDVYFECTIRANPRAYRVDWKFEGRFLNHNISAGVIISNQSLVLQKVRRLSAGAYTCIAKNVEGDGESNTVILKVKHAPVCRPSQKLVYGVARHESEKIVCEVNANPHLVTFKWAFNNTSEYLDVAQAKFTSGGTRSTITYTPRTEFDYGVLYCWGRNDIGEQREPCKFTVIAAGPPDMLHNCTIVNQTEDALHVECVESFDGGMPQHFIMEIYDAQSHQLKTNVSSPTPIFQVNGLDSGTGFMISVYAANVKGRSDSLALTASTLRIAERRTGTTPNFLPITPILGVLIGVVAALVLVAVIIVIVMRLRAPDEEKKTEPDSESVEKEPMSSLPRSHASLKKELEDFESADEKNPDVVPNEDDAVYADVDEKGDHQKMNNINNRIYENVVTQQGNNENTYENVNNIRNQPGGRKVPVSKPEDVTYAELQLPNNQRGSSTVRRVAEPTVYAQIDHLRKAPPSTQHDPDEDDLLQPTAETPLMNSHRESTV